MLLQGAQGTEKLAYFARCAVESTQQTHTRNVDSTDGKLRALQREQSDAQYSNLTGADRKRSVSAGGGRGAWARRDHSSALRVQFRPQVVPSVCSEPKPLHMFLVVASWPRCASDSSSAAAASRDEIHAIVGGVGEQLQRLVQLLRCRFARAHEGVCQW